MSRRRSLRTGLALFLSSLLWAAAFGVEGTFYVGGGETEDKPQSKLWFHDGTWWGVLPDGEDIYFYKLENGILQKQSFPDAMVSSSKSAHADVLWNGTDLFVLLVRSSRAILSKYSYDSANQQYDLLDGFPFYVPVVANCETATIAQDTTGKLWVAWEEGLRIHVTWSTSSDHKVWDPAGMVLHDGVDSDDIAAVVAFDGQVGVMWSDQVDQSFGFRIHVDGDPDSAWNPTEIVAQGNEIADDHINLAVTSTNDVLAATKDARYGDMNLFVRWSDTGWEGPFTVSFGGTRPIVVFDEENVEVYFFYRSGGLLYKNAPLTQLYDLAFLDPQVLISNSKATDVTSTKQSVDSTKGLLVAAKARSTGYYASVDIPFNNIPPTATADATPTSGIVPLFVQFTGDGSDEDGVVVAYDWDFGDGTTSQLQHPTHTYTDTGSYTVRLTVTDDGGRTGDDTLIVTVTPDPANNTAPVVDAGPDQEVTLPNTTVLQGSVTDDGLPTPDSLSMLWTQLSGPYPVTFSDPTIPTPTVTFAGPGIYELQLTADDTVYSSSDEVLVTVYEAPPGVTIQIPVAHGNDDVEEKASGGMSISSNDLDLGDDTVGLRLALDVPAGAAILAAHVQFATDEPETGATSMTVYGEATLIAAPFSSTRYDVTSRARTAASVFWSPPPWPLPGEAADPQRTPDLSAILQEIVNQPGWARGNAAVLIFEAVSGKREAITYNQDESEAPTLHVTYAE